MPKRKNTSDDEDSLSAENYTTDAESSSAAEAAKTTSKKAKPQEAKSTAPPPKKAKSADHPSSISQTQTADGGINGAKIITNSEGNKYINLGKKKRATVRSFKGVMLLDIREYYGTEADEKPGKKGICLTLEQWNLLREGSSNIDKLFLQKE